ncbi:pyruvate kinase [Isosphaeraceae bacterium EP7]
MTIRLAEPFARVRTKIVATVGPASRSPETLGELINVGVDVFRLNFSHGTHDDHTETLARIRDASAAADRLIPVLQDLGGPKIRLGVIPGDSVVCALNDVFTLVRDRTEDDPRQLTCTYRELPDDLKVGDPLLFADGAVAMIVTAAEPGRVKLSVTLAGIIKTKQGINLPGAALKVEALTPKDLLDLDWTAAHQVEYVGLSFVRRAEDVTRLRAELAARGCHARIIAKIEKPEAVDNLASIIAVSDAVMVARGDLGVEMDVARVPAIQKQIISACHRARVPVITATQMLNSMEQSSRPTRAEATDVFNAVLDGTDAVMLSGETAAGLYPVEAASTMSRIVTEAERHLFSGEYGARDHTPAYASPANAIPSNANLVLADAIEDGPSASSKITPITEALAEAASLVSRRLDAALLVVATRSGRTALTLSKLRHATPTIALADTLENARAMGLFWGVTALHVPGIVDGQHAMKVAIDWAKARNLVEKGDCVVLVRGWLPSTTVHNALLVDVI